MWDVDQTVGRTRDHLIQRENKILEPAGITTAPRSNLVAGFFDALAKRLRENACSYGMLTSRTLDKRQSLIDGFFEVAKHEPFLFDLALEPQRALESDAKV